MPVLIVTGLGPSRLRPQYWALRLNPSRASGRSRHSSGRSQHVTSSPLTSRATTRFPLVRRFQSVPPSSVSANPSPSLATTARCPNPSRHLFSKETATRGSRTPIVRNQDGTWEATPTVPIRCLGCDHAGGHVWRNATQEATYPGVSRLHFVSLCPPGDTQRHRCSRHDAERHAHGQLLFDGRHHYGRSRARSLRVFGQPLESPLGLVAVDAQLDEPTSEYPVISDVPWHATLTIPNQVNGGQYFVTAACMADNRGFPGSYASQPITITSSGLAAVTPLSNKDLVSRKDLPGGWGAQPREDAPLPGCFVQASPACTRWRLSAGPSYVLTDQRCRSRTLLRTPILSTPIHRSRTHWPSAPWFSVRVHRMAATNPPTTCVSTRRSLRPSSGARASSISGPMGAQDNIGRWS